MDAFKAFLLPIQGLSLGFHEFEYTLDDAFFSLFEESPIEQADLLAVVTVERKQSMLVLDFFIEGEIVGACDRCLADIWVPAETDQRLFVKFSDTITDSEDDEVVFVSTKESSFNLAPYLYEFGVLAMPYFNRIDCENEENSPCDQDVLSRISGVIDPGDEDNQQPKGKSPWDLLSKLDSELDQDPKINEQ